VKRTVRGEPIVGPTGGICAKQHYARAHLIGNVFIVDGKQSCEITPQSLPLQLNCPLAVWAGCAQQVVGVEPLDAMRRAAAAYHQVPNISFHDVCAK
jgi:hypothetical protein